ncbi:MAG: response regulator transcription factor [Clostridia bacterium]|nr:response regulator transcription factor [Clostridia bacterium]
MYTILVCDDDENIVRALRTYLEEDGYAVVEAFDGRQALEALEKETVHLVLMDVMMPKMDGISALAEMRRNSNVPVILLTAKSEFSDKVLGLNIGADDYITKPFDRSELLARVRSQVRRYVVLGNNAPQDTSTLRCGGIEMDDESKTVTVDGAEADLTPIEYKILRLFLMNTGKVLSHKEIYQHVWEDEPFGSSSTVLVHIRHLRQKIEINPAEPRYILSVWGHGYKMEKRNDA